VKGPGHEFEHAPPSSNEFKNYSISLHGIQDDLYFTFPVSLFSYQYVSFFFHCTVKVKCTLVQALRLCTGRMARRGSRGIARLRLCTGRTAHRGVEV
jgi:hypothetical protein